MDQLSVEEAARRMGLHPAHVRRLVRVGELSGQKVGGRWLVDGDALRQRDRLRPAAGRPLSPNMAWAVMTLVGGGLSPGSHPWVRNEPAGRQARYRLRRLIADAPPPERWAAWLRRRGRPERMAVHPGVRDRLAVDPRLHRGAEAAAAAGGVGVGAGIGEDLVFYVNESDFDGVIRDYRAWPDPDGLLLMVIPGEVDENLRPAVGFVEPAVALVDLLGSSDARQRHHAAEMLGSAVQRVNLGRGQP